MSWVSILFPMVRGMAVAGSGLRLLCAQCMPTPLQTATNPRLLGLGCVCPGGLRKEPAGNSKPPKEARNCLLGVYWTLVRGTDEHRTLWVCRSPGGAVEWQSTASEPSIATLSPGCIAQNKDYLSPALRLDCPLPYTQH